MEQYTPCPHCRHAQYTLVTTCRDHMISHETFSIVRCTKCGLMRTLEAPNEYLLSRYYKSHEYLSHQSQGRGFVKRLYNRLRQIRTECRVAKVIQRHGVIPQRALEIGAGIGTFAQALHSRGCEVYIVEQSEEARQLSLAALGDEHCFPSTKALMEQNETDLEGSMDLISLWHSLEHLPDLNFQLDACRSLLKPGGQLIIAIPNAQSLDSYHYRNYWAGYDVPRHLWHFTPHTLRQCIESHGFRQKKLYPLHLDVYYISLLSEKYQKNGVLTPGSWIRACCLGLYFQIRSLVHPLRASAILYYFDRE